VCWFVCIAVHPDPGADALVQAFPSPLSVEDALTTPLGLATSAGKKDTQVFCVLSNGCSCDFFSQSRRRLQALDRLLRGIRELAASATTVSVMVYVGDRSEKAIQVNEKRSIAEDSLPDVFARPEPGIRFLLTGGSPPLRRNKP